MILLYAARAEVGAVSLRLFFGNFDNAAGLRIPMTNKAFSTPGRTSDTEVQWVTQKYRAEIIPIAMNEYPLKYETHEFF